MQATSLILEKANAIPRIARMDADQQQQVEISSCRRIIRENPRHPRFIVYELYPVGRLQKRLGSMRQKNCPTETAGQLVDSR
jgi:hypothetical protein